MSSLLYGGWMMLFLGRRKVIDYKMFARQAENSNKTYQMITSMQEIKLQTCERRRREEWEQVQTDLLDVQTKSLKLSQQQEAGCVLINEVKNIVITVLSATAVIHGDLTLGMILAIQYIIGQLNTPVAQLMNFFYTLRDVIMNLILIFDTKIGRDGVGLSQGQKQRILIARAVYKDPDFIFLDEATNSLDAKNERQIVKNLEQFYKGKTVVVVAHRLSTVKHADQIVVLDSGRVVEIGTHDELVSKRGAYYELVKNLLELGS